MTTTTAPLNESSRGRGPGTVDDTPEKRGKKLSTTTRENGRIVDIPSRIVDTEPVDDNTPSHLASSTPVDDPSPDEPGIADTRPCRRPPARPIA
jgi:hypothetical protein